MADIGIVDGLATSATLRDFARQAGGRTTTVRPDSRGDQVEISEIARFLSRLAELPEDRARRIVDIRNRIDEGTFVTSERLSIATERLFEDIEKSELVSY